MNKIITYVSEDIFKLVQQIEKLLGFAIKRFLTRTPDQ